MVSIPLMRPLAIAGAAPSTTTNKIAPSLSLKSSNASGYHATDGMVISHAVLYGGGRMVDLNSVVDETPYTLGSASGIDEAGNIVVTTTNGPMRALLLCPQ